MRDQYYIDTVLSLVNDQHKHITCNIVRLIAPVLLWLRRGCPGLHRAVRAGHDPRGEARLPDLWLSRPLGAEQHLPAYLPGRAGSDQ